MEKRHSLRTSSTLGSKRVAHGEREVRAEAAFSELDGSSRW
jgi:hypothetical protein